MRNPSEKRAMERAANSTMAPCAKLKTPEALKMSTKPNATREYNMPTIKPPNNVSRKNAIALSPFALPYLPFVLSLSKGI